MKTLAKKLQLILVLTAVCFFLSITVVTSNAYADEGGERYVDPIQGLNFILHKGATPEENTATVVAPENGIYSNENYWILDTIKENYKIVKIDDRAFAGCKNLKSLKTDCYLKIIGNHTFENCSNLTNVEFYNRGLSPIESIGKFAFSGCKKLTEIELSGDAHYRTFGDQAFYDCPNLKRFAFHDCEKIDFGQAVFGCSPNVQIDLIKTCLDPVYAVCDGALYSADMKTLYAYPSAKETVTIKDGVENIAPNAFMGCKDLKKVIFPKSIQTIGKYSFALMPGCGAKYDFEFKGAKPNIDSKAFYRVTLINITYNYHYMTSWYKSSPNLGNAYHVNYKMI